MDQPSGPPRRPQRSMSVRRPTAADEAAFRELLPDRADVLSSSCSPTWALVNGNMFPALFGSSVGVKLADRDRAALLEVAGSGPFRPPKRPMGGWVSLPARWHSPDSPAADWVARALEYVTALPAKQPKGGE